MNPQQQQQQQGKQGNPMTEADASRIQSSQAKNNRDVSSGSFSARAQSAGDKHEYQQSQQGYNTGNQVIYELRKKELVYHRLRSKPGVKSAKFVLLVTRIACPSNLFSD